MLRLVYFIFDFIIVKYVFKSSSVKKANDFEK